MNAFYRGNGVGDRGTLCNVRDFFRHHSLKTKVMENFQHVYDFYEVSENHIKHIYDLNIASDIIILNHTFS